MENRKQVIEQAFANEIPERVPAVFWYHFTDFSEHCRGLSNPEIIQRVIDGHKRMYDELKPDFLKIMSDGFFGHPSMIDQEFNQASDLKKIKSLGPNQPWIDKQIAMVNELIDYTNHEVPIFYSVFSPLSAIRLHFFEDENDSEKFTRLFFEDPEQMVSAAKEIEKDLLYLMDRLAKETHIDGIYYSVQEVQDSRADEEFHKKYVKNSDVSILESAHNHDLEILLHICGWGDFTNNLELYTDYPCDIVNWATHTERISLKEGKKLFGDKPVVGGFDNNPGTLLYEGSDEEIKAYVEELLRDSGTKGVIIGADCTVDPGIDHKRLQFVREVAKDFRG